ncbi:hypothetical protein BLOT_014560 [Blomia tropicalis]|nr:hypothetical protein BLOT_014560 [Blomia tropicalis]
MSSSQTLKLDFSTSAHVLIVSDMIVNTILLGRILDKLRCKFGSSVVCSSKQMVKLCNVDIELIDFHKSESYSLIVIVNEIDLTNKFHLVQANR